MKNLKKYPVILFFGLALYLVSLLDVFSPIQEFSDLENRKLEKFPKFSMKALVENKYTPKIEDFTEDHFILRNFWISLKSISESVLGKNENNGIVYGKDDYLFTKILGQDYDNRQKNTDALTKFIQNNTQTNVKVLIAPTAPSVLTEMVKPGSPVDNITTLNAHLQHQLGKEYLVDVTEVLKAKSNEYIFYKTDHHWTTLGAFYAYEEYMKSIGKTPLSLEDFSLVSSENFLGTHYSKSKNFDVQPDVLSYVQTDAEIEIMGKNYPVYDYEKLDTRDKYAMFLRGNNSISSIQGDGQEKILVIKDSFANCFIPFLIPSFEKIDILDMRFFNQSVKNLIAENQYEYVLFLYNSESFDSDIYIPRINMYS